MKYGINTIDDFDFKGKTVLCRIDINQPVDKATCTVKDTTRIVGCAPTLRELSDKGAKLVLMAHQGGDLEYKNYFTLRYHAPILSELLGKPVEFIEDVCGPYAVERIKNLKDGEMILLENVRFLGEELTLFETKLNLSHAQQAQSWLVRTLAPLGDLYVCDAFATAHRDQPSMCGFEQVLPSCMGRLFEKEYAVISAIMSEPKRPCVFVLGGAKIEDAFLMLRTVLSNGSADKVLVGGLAANVLLASSGVNLGKASLDFIASKNMTYLIEKSKEILEQYANKIVLPQDLACVTADGTRVERKVTDLRDDELYIDIGSEYADTCVKAIDSANTVFANGPMGVFEKEPSQLGTERVWNALGATEAHTVIGGGDSITAAKKFKVFDKISYVCTGGGALVRFLAGEELPAIKALKEGASRK